EPALILVLEDRSCVYGEPDLSAMFRLLVLKYIVGKPVCEFAVFHAGVERKGLVGEAVARLGAGARRVPWRKGRSRPAGNPNKRKDKGKKDDGSTRKKAHCGLRVAKTRDSPREPHRRAPAREASVDEPSTGVHRESRCPRRSAMASVDTRFLW